MLPMRIVLLLCILFGILSQSWSGPVAFGYCASGCSTLLAGCIAGGVVSTAGAGTPIVALTCPQLYTVCMASCAGLGLALPF